MENCVNPNPVQENTNIRAALATNDVIEVGLRINMPVSLYLNSLSSEITMQFDSSIMKLKLGAYRIPRTC